MNAADTFDSAAGMSAAEAFDAIRLGTEIQRRIGVKTSRDEPLARFTTMRVGGPADLFAEVHNAFELRGIVRLARGRGAPYFVMGRGSDLVVSDAGIRGLVVHVRAQGLSVEGDRIVAEAGVPMARIATEAHRAGLTGLEFALAIPGSIGGAVWANAGAHASDVAAVIETADIVTAGGVAARLPATELGLAYRESRFKHPAADGLPEVVVAAAFRLTPEDPAIIRERLDDVRRWRRAHQPLGIPSAGSVFRNPPGDSAGRLIEAAGLKGRRIGGAVVSEMHANWILNDRKGSAADVRGLCELVRYEVLRRTGIELASEVEFVGDWLDWDRERPAEGAAAT